MRRQSITIAISIMAVTLAVAAGASEVRIFRLQSQEAFVGGTFEGVSVDSLGTLRLTAAATRVTPLEEPFVLSAAVHPEGWVVGTGNAGRVLLVRPDGAVSELMAAPEPEVFAVWVDPGGTVFAGTSPEGKVYRIENGKTEVFFDPEQTYIWQLAGGEGGSLLVATGTEGKLFEVDGRGTGEVLWDSDDTHVRALAVSADGEILAGTAGEGLIVHIDRRGRVRTLYDAIQPEVVAIAFDEDGSAHAAIVASEASQRPPKQQTTTEGETSAEGSVVVVVEEQQPEIVGSRPSGYKGPRSEILHITPGGTVRTVAELQEETVYSLASLGGHLWIGTGLEGKLYTLSGEDLVLENDVEERQIMALLPDDGHPAFATTNAAAFYRLAVDRARQGSYTSPALDAQQISGFGTFRWRGQAVREDQVRFSFRSGVSSEPDRTWSEWTDWTRGREIGLEYLPPARYVQFRVKMSGREGAGPILVGAELSYLQQNLAPRISRLDVLGPGEILVPASFNPGKQVFEPDHRSRDGIFTTLRASGNSDDVRVKPLWKGGYRTLRWEAADANGDELSYRIDFRPVEGQGEWFAVAEDLTDSHYSFDAAALPDGVYRFRVRASDRRHGDGLEAERISEPVVIDHTPPRLVGTQRRDDQVVVEVTDALNPLRAASFSINGEEWQPATPADGLLDGLKELIEVPFADGDALVILRVSDAAFNAVTFDLTTSLP